jgi:hypothetical protein
MSKSKIAKKIWKNRSKAERSLVAMKAVMTRKENEYKRSLIAMKAVVSRVENIVIADLIDELAA